MISNYTLEVERIYMANQKTLIKHGLCFGRVITSQISRNETVVSVYRSRNAMHK